VIGLKLIYGWILARRYNRPFPKPTKRHISRLLRQRPAAFRDLLRILKCGGYATGWLGGNG